MKCFDFRLVPSVLASIAALGLAAPASAQLDIVIEFDARSSDSPAWDPSGACLTSAVQAAADYWEALYPGIPAKEIRFKYRWYNYYAHSHVGLTPMNWDEFGSWADTRRRLGGVLTPDQYVARFWTYTASGETPWYVDDDPDEHSEFDLTPRMYLWPSDSGTWLGLSSVPAGDIEVGFAGSARAGDEAVSSCSGLAASEGVDLFSVALHEIGHALGLGFRGEGDANADGDYDAWSPVHVGATGVEAFIETTGDLDPAHLHAGYALMYPYISAGVRRLPSMIDILVIAQINGWTTFDLPRTYREATAGYIPWSDAAAWLGSIAPASGLGAVLYSTPGDDDVYLSASASADGVFVGDLSLLDVGSRTLDAGERVSLAPDTSLVVDGGSVTCGALIHHGDSLDVSSGSLFASRFVEADGNAAITLALSQMLVPGGIVRLRGADLFVGGAQVECALLDLETTGAKISGDYNLSQFTDLLELVNDGTIIANNGNLEFQPAGSGVFFDLDGDQDLIGNPELGQIEAAGGSIVFGAPALDPFAGLMRIWGTRSITVATSLAVDGGTIQFLGDNSRLFPGNLELHSGLVEVYGPAGTDGFIHGQQTWWSGASAAVDLACGLHLLGVSHYWGGTVSGGDGFVRQGGNVVVHNLGMSTVMEVARYLWDGEPLGGGGGGVFSTTTLLPGATLDIRGAIGSGVAGDGYDGVVHVRSGATLILQQNWTLEGQLVLEGGSVVGPGVITNAGLISGYGNIGTTVVNNGNIQCVAPGLSWIGGSLVIGTGVCQPGCEP